MTRPGGEAAEPVGAPAAALPQERARALFEAYLANRYGDGSAQTSASDPASRVRRWGRRVVPQRFRLRMRVAATALAARPARRRAQRIDANTAVRLHLGSGPVRKPGWVNVDLLGDRVDLAWNLLKPLPFGEGTVEAIFHEHLLEHLSLEEGYRLACESYRVLRPTGVLRIGVPDCGAPHIAWPDAPTRLLALQEFFAEAGHRTMYDTETLSLVLKAAGFPTVEQRPFGDSRLEPAPDGEHRRIGSLYVEAVK
jgi:predicted SAM-dependent methyltransferase